MNSHAYHKRGFRLWLHDLRRRREAAFWLIGGVIVAPFVILLIMVASQRAADGDIRACVHELEKLNKLSSSEIVPRMQLKLPNGSTYSVRSGDRLWTICEREVM